MQTHTKPKTDDPSSAHHVATKEEFSVAKAGVNKRQLPTRMTDTFYFNTLLFAFSMLSSAFFTRMGKYIRFRINIDLPTAMPMCKPRECVKSVSALLGA